MESDANDSILNEVANTKIEKKGFAGFKQRLHYTDPSSGTVVDTEIRRVKVDVEPAFPIEGIIKVGPQGYPLRWGAPADQEWDVWEKRPDGEAKINQSQIRYLQDGVDVPPLEATRILDINEQRTIQECEPQGDVALGTLIPRDMVSTFAPDPKRGSTLEEVSGDAGLKTLADKMDAEKLSAFFPLVKRKGITVHAACMYTLHVDGKRYMAIQTFGGTAKWTKPIPDLGATESVKTPTLAAIKIGKKKPQTAAYQ